MKPFPEPVSEAVALDAACLGDGAFALAAPDRPDEARTAELTRAQRAKLSRRVRAWLKVRDESGRPGGTTPYALDTAMVGLTIERLATTDLKVEAAAREICAHVQTALADHQGRDLLLGHDKRAFSSSKNFSSVDARADVERIADKVRAALVGEQTYTSAKGRQQIIDGELDRLRQNWAQLQHVRCEGR